MQAARITRLATFIFPIRLDNIFVANSIPGQRNSATWVGGAAAVLGARCVTREGKDEISRDSELGVSYPPWNPAIRELIAKIPTDAPSRFIERSELPPSGGPIDLSEECYAP
jgi:hypothetical protein